MVLLQRHRLAAVLLGYAAAILLGAAAVWLKNLGVSAADQLAMSGMFAFGDAVTFLGVAAVVSIPPTVLVFQSIGPRPGFWRAYSILSLLASLTGLVAGALLIARPLPETPLFRALVSLAPLRVLAGPMFLAAFAPGLLPVAARHRRVSLLACAFELCAMGSFLVLLLGSR